MDTRQLLPRSEQNSTRGAPLAPTPPAKAGYAIRVSLACLQCRSRHLKCDAYQPTCSQCKLKDIECTYPKSRRGGSDKTRKTPQKRADDQQGHLEESQSPIVNRQSASSVPSTSHPVRSSQRNNAFLPGSMSNNTGSIAVSSSQTGENNSTSETLTDSFTWISDLSSSRGLDYDPESELLVELYYKFFHDAHPFVLPRTALMDRRKYDSSTMQPLMLSMQFVGSIYIDNTDPEVRRKAFQAVFESNSQPNGFLVQASLLLAIALHCKNELEDARNSLDITIRMALDLGMGMREYAVQNGEGSSVLEESWRRTWWMIFITDCLFAGIRFSPMVLLRTVITTADLPCEDENYKRGVSHFLPRLRRCF
jgi:hypothetical protein